MAVVFVNEQGRALSQATIAHSQAGFGQLDGLRQQLGVAAADCVVGLETAHSLVIDWLWGHGYHQVYVIPPNVTRSRQSSYRQSGARTDHSDASLLGNLLRTDRHRLMPWRPDSALTQQLRAKVGLANQLRQVLQRYYPTALDLFSLESYIALEFIQRYPTPQPAQRLSHAEFAAFAHQPGWPRPTPACKPPSPRPCRPQCWPSRRRRCGGRRCWPRCSVAQHADAAIFASLPGVGAALAPALLVKCGDERQRFPTATAPVTEQSGKRRCLRFRRACDHEFRTYAQEWAQLSLSHSPWACAYVDQAQKRRLSFSHACRALANRWLAVLCKLWQTRQTYDPSIHLAQTLLGRERRS